MRSRLSRHSTTVLVHFVRNDERNMRRFEKYFLKYAELSRFCTALMIGVAKGLCNCMVVREECSALTGKHWDKMYSKMAFCGVHHYLHGQNKRRSIRREKHWQYHIKKRLCKHQVSSCECPVTSSHMILETSNKVTNLCNENTCVNTCWIGKLA